MFFAIPNIDFLFNLNSKLSCIYDNLAKNRNFKFSRQLEKPELRYLQNGKSHRLEIKLVGTGVLNFLFVFDSNEALSLTDFLEIAIFYC